MKSTKFANEGGINDFNSMLHRVLLLSEHQGFAGSVMGQERTHLQLHRNSDVGAHQMDYSPSGVYPTIGISLLRGTRQETKHKHLP